MVYTSANRTSLQPLLFDFSSMGGLFPCPPTEMETRFASCWNMAVSVMPTALLRTNSFGRKAYCLSDILAVRMVMLFFGTDTVSAAIEKLNSSPNLRAITGMERVPSGASVSRNTERLISIMDVYKVHEKIVKPFYEDRLVCNLSIDSTPVDAREAPQKRAPKPELAPKERKERKAALRKLEESGDIRAYLSTLEDGCSITGKKNSKGYIQYRIGYKVHLAVDDGGIPVAFFITGACVHDSRMAISLMRMAKGRCEYMYVLMDGGYSSKAIEDFAKGADVVPVIDFKADRNGVKREMDPAKKVRFRARTTVERTNSELKECFLPAKLYSRGRKAQFDLQLACLMITIKKIKDRLEKEAAFKAA